MAAFSTAHQAARPALSFPWPLASPPPAPQPPSNVPPGEASVPGWEGRLQACWVLALSLHPGLTEVHPRSTTSPPGP